MGQSHIGSGWVVSKGSVVFLRKYNIRRRTLSLRLSISYMVIFVTTSLLVLSIFYHRISTVTMTKTDNELIEEFNDFKAMAEDGNRGRIMVEFDRECTDEADKNEFYRLLSRDGRVLRSSGAMAGNVPVMRSGLSEIDSRSDYKIETVKMPERAYSVRCIYGAATPTILFNMGLSLKDNYAYLHIFRNLIFLLMIPLFLIATLIGWFLARQALQGVEEVTQTAMKIADGSIEKRVAVKRRSYEIDRLTNTFNSMLDRIQTLITGMKQMNDNIAHDLRSPLTRIRGIAEMTLMGGQSVENFKEMAVTTVEECDKLIEIINTMLEITETEAGVNPGQSETVDLVKLITSACELFEPIAEERGVHVETVLPTRMEIKCDRKKLQRLVTNLLENAIKYNRHDGLVTIDADIVDQRARIRVTDTGCGIAEEELDKIFKRFYRCDRSRSHPGIGLGLSLAKAIVESLGGDICVKSVLSQGSSFLVSFPV